MIFSFSAFHVPMKLRSDAVHAQFQTLLSDCSTELLPEGPSSSQQGEANTFRWKIS